MTEKPFKITEVFAFVVTEADGTEGIPAHLVGYEGVEMMMPLVGADSGRIEQLRPIAEQLAATGVPVELRRFSQMETVEKIGVAPTDFGLGFCPECGASGIGAEEAADGKTVCMNRHQYPHADRLPSPR